jgi:hypothetical protein
MKFKIDGVQIEEAHRLAAVKVAGTLGIKDADKLPTEALMEIIKSSNSPLKKPFFEYIEAYDNWAYYYMQYNNKELSEAVSFTMQKLIAKKNDSRNKLENENRALKQHKK